jgi:hypothetical protein
MPPGARRPRRPTVVAFTADPASSPDLAPSPDAADAAETRTYTLRLEGHHFTLTERTFCAVLGQCLDQVQARWAPTPPRPTDPPESPDERMERAFERVHAWALRYQSGPADLAAQLTRLRATLALWRTRRGA